MLPLRPCLLVTTRTRPLHPDDVPQLVALTLAAWAPVFASLRATLGDELYDRLRPNWQRDQEDAVRTLCEQQDGMTVRVAETADAKVVGFVAFTANPDTGMGVVEMLGVDPDHQGHGLGTQLSTLAFDALRDAGMRVAMVETGGDPGHAPARRTYEKAGCTLLPIARYFTALDSS